MLEIRIEFFLTSNRNEIEAHIFILHATFCPSITSVYRLRDSNAERKIFACCHSHFINSYFFHVLFLCFFLFFIGLPLSCRSLSVSFFIISIFWLRMNHEVMHAIWIFSHPDEFPFPLIIDTAFAWLAYSRFLPSISPPARPLSSPVWARNYERLQLNIYPIQFILVYKYMCMHICLLPWTYSLLFALGRKLERTNAHENFWQEDPQGPFFPGRL